MSVRTHPSTLRRLAAFLRPLRWGLLAGAALGSATVGASVGLIGAAAWLIATAALHPSIAELQVAIVGVRFFGISRGLFRYAERLVNHDLTFRFLASVRVWFVGALAPLAPARLLDRSVSDLVDRAAADVETLEGLTIRSVTPPLVAAVVGLGVAGFLARWSWAAAGVFLAAYGAAAVVLPVIVWRQSAANGRRAASRRAEVADAVVDFVLGLGDVLAFNRGAAARRVAARAHSSLSRSEARDAATDALGDGAVVLATHLAAVGVLVVGIPMVTGGFLSGVMLCVLTLVTVAAFEAAAPLAASARHLHRQVAAADRLFDIVDDEPAVVDAAGPVEPLWVAQHAAPSIVFDAVTLVYPGTDHPALEAVDLRIEGGSRVALVGPSGAGKSTIAHLIQRFWDPDSGRVLLGDADLRSMPLDAVRRQIAVVSQDTVLFTGTIADNLRLADPECSDEDLRRAAGLAALEGTLAELPDGLKTFVGEQGLQLSGGQRQRLSVARALLQRPSILLLDEPTAHLDPATGAELLDRVFSAFEGTTTLHITHRLESMDRYDQIVVFDQGWAVQRGRHETLAATDGLYRRLWEADRGTW